MSAVVTCWFEWGSLLGEGSTSLKTTILLLSQWNDHLNCSNLMVVLLSGPSYSSLVGTFGFSGWSMIPNCVILFGVNYTLTMGKVVVSVIYCDPGSGSLMSDLPVPLLWSGAASVQVMMAGGTMFAVSRLWSWLVSSFSVFPVMLRAQPGVAISVCLVVCC